MDSPPFGQQAPSPALLPHGEKGTRTLVSSPQGEVLQFSDHGLSVLDFANQNEIGEADKQPVFEDAGNIVDGLF